MKTFKEMTQVEDTLMIIDALNLAFRWKHSGATTFVDDYIKTVESLKRSYKAKYIIIACDQGSSSYRKNIYPEYKQNRKDKQELQTEQEQLQFEIFFEEFLRTIDAINVLYPVLKFEKVEADDIAAYIVRNRLKFPNISKYVLISSDKDWDLLIQHNVMRFSYVTRKETTLDNWDIHYAFAPEDYISIKCLQGDAGDNVPGVPGVGPVKACSLVKEYGTAYDVAACIPIASKYKYIQAINEFGMENILRNYKLMDLLEFCEEAIGEENCKIIAKTVKELINE